MLLAILQGGTAVLILPLRLLRQEQRRRWRTVQRDLLGPRARHRRQFPGLLATQAFLVTQAFRETRDHRDHLASQVAPSLALLVPLACLATKERSEIQVRWARLDSAGFKALRGMAWPTPK